MALPFRCRPNNTYVSRTLLDHPANKIPYTFNDEIANKYRSPKFKSQTTIPSEKGITDHPIKLKVKISEGATKKTLILALVGNVVSFTNSFKPSARGCSNPIKPTAFGPLLLCTAPMIFRSAIVKYATETSNGITMLRILKIVISAKNILG